MFNKEFLTKSSWGWLPILVYTASFGLLVTSLAMVASIDNKSYAMYIFWSGILTITIPIGIRLSYQDIQVREALALVILAGEMLFLVSMLRSFIQNSPYDGFLHWRTASDIINTHHLFAFNNLLPVSPYYPGLEIVTTALVNLTGFPIFDAGNVVVFVARLIMVTSLFLILRELSGSNRAAGLGSLIYMGSTTFVFFDTQFAYESLSLPLAILVLWLVLKHSFVPAPQKSTWAILAVLVGVMVAITHHLMSYFLIAILLVWTGLAIIRNRRGLKEYIPIRITIILLVFVVTWLVFIADITVGYLAPYIGATLTTLLKFISGYQGDRAVFLVDQSTSLLLERLVAVASVLFLILGEGLGLWVWWKSYRKKIELQSAFAITLLLTSLIYPLLPLLHLNNSTWEVADRLASFIFIGLAIVIGLGLAENQLNMGILYVRSWMAMPALALIICAGIIGGSHPLTRLPGSYLVEADSRSNDSFGLSAAEWALAYLGPNNRMASDREQSILMGSFGQQSMIFGGTNQVNISPIFLNPSLNRAEKQAIKSLKLHYLVVDWRITQAAPVFGYYFENWEQQVAPSKVPVAPEALEKFENSPDVNRIFDNGYIRIYDTGGISLVP